MTLEERFDLAAVRAKALPKPPDNQQLLQLYGRYKQATEGNVVGPAPGGFDFVAVAKYNAWKDLHGTPRQEAMEAYVALVDALGSAG